MPCIIFLCPPSSLLFVALRPFASLAGTRPRTFTSGWHRPRTKRDENCRSCWNACMCLVLAWPRLMLFHNGDVYRIAPCVGTWELPWNFLQAYFAPDLRRKKWPMQQVFRTIQNHPEPWVLYSCCTTAIPFHAERKRPKFCHHRALRSTYVTPLASHWALGQFEETACWLMILRVGENGERLCDFCGAV